VESKDEDNFEKRQLSSGDWRKTLYITDQKWKEMNDNAIANLHLALASVVLSNIAEKTTTKEN